MISFDAQTSTEVYLTSGCYLPPSRSQIVHNVFVRDIRLSKIFTGNHLQTAKPMHDHEFYFLVDIAGRCLSFRSVSVIISNHRESSQV